MTRPVNRRKAEMTKQYDGPAVLCPDLLREQASLRCAELHSALNSALSAIDALIDEKPMLAAKVCGSTTLGNLRVEIRGVLHGR